MLHFWYHLEDRSLTIELSLKKRQINAFEVDCPTSIRGKKMDWVLFLLVNLWTVTPLLLSLPIVVICFLCTANCIARNRIWSFESSVLLCLYAVCWHFFPSFFLYLAVAILVGKRNAGNYFNWDLLKLMIDTFSFKIKKNKSSFFFFFTLSLIFMSY